MAPAARPARVGKHERDDRRQGTPTSPRAAPVLARRARILRRCGGGLPASARGQVPKGSQHSPWQLLEHLRLAQADILEFCVSRRYEEKQWPRDYWPATAAPPSARAWNASIAAFRSDRRTLERLVLNPRRDLLAPVPAGTGQTLLREVLLAADHAAYHIGQLVAVRRALGHWAGPKLG